MFALLRNYKKLDCKNIKLSISTVIVQPADLLMRSMLILTAEQLNPRKVLRPSLAARNMCATIDDSKSIAVEKEYEKGKVITKACEFISDSMANHWLIRGN